MNPEYEYYLEESKRDEQERALSLSQVFDLILTDVEDKSSIGELEKMGLTDVVALIKDGKVPEAKKLINQIKRKMIADAM